MTRKETPIRRSGGWAGWTGAALAVVLPATGSAQVTVPFEPGMVVTRSVRIQPGVYRAPAPASVDSALVVIRGDGITVDLTGVVLEGLDPDRDPDQAAGVAIRVDGGRGVTVRGATVRGYRFAVLARGTHGLTLVGNDLSHSWKPRLFSLTRHESIVDWLSFHDNEDREWMRYGAAVYLEDVVGGEIRQNRAVQGMNGLLMTRSDSLLVRNNTFAFNSGVGIGLYRSHANALVGNRLDFNVRGYSHGVYERGQDSAGILLYAQSSNNVVAYNSATHSGDGLFLWAGRHTMDTGQGGANDNLIFYNDFSFAPTNAIEVTFSRNQVLGNLLRGSRYGVWGGYSWDTEIRGNCFANNRHGVAIEHGQNNRIIGNRFDGDSLVISLWARESEPADWGYPKHRDTRSRDHRVTDNVMAGNRALWRLERTMRADTSGNHVLDRVADDACSPRALLGAGFDSLRALVPATPADIPASATSRLPRSAIVVDAWGPYDWASPKLWPVDTARSVVRLATLGPPGSWRVERHRGVATIAPEHGRIGDVVTVTSKDSVANDWAVELVYTGAEAVSPRVRPTPAGTEVPFAFRRFDPALDWDVRFFAWSDSAGDPHRAPERFDRMFRTAPRLRRREPRLDYVWFRPLVDGVPEARWALEADAEVNVPDGEFSLRAISDDGVRVWVDDVLAIDDWEPHGSAVAYAAISSGPHRVRVRYFQLTGWAEVRVELVPGSARSPGSPGPH